MPQPSSYTLLDFGNQQRLERWGPYRLVRPDPAAAGRPTDPSAWKTPDATYLGEKGKGVWRTARDLPREWPVDFDDLRLLVRLAPYKHTGVFPEQQQNWSWLRDRARAAHRPLNILNLFAYTGGATMALAKDGHRVTHVDASKPAITWAKQNATLNDIPADRIRWILDDAPTFVARERRRQKTYDGILLDPPAFGHSPTGKAWRIDRDLPPLLENCLALLTPSPAFLLLNTYAQHDTPKSLHRFLAGSLHATPFSIHTQELLLTTPTHRKLSTGVVARCQ
jgi:23S rRNA (cytosine1962-C5)-methyltransferase